MLASSFNRHQKIPRRPRIGFTLIELLIVVAIIAILAAIAVPNFLEAQTRSKISRVRADFHSLASALESYVIDNNHYPWFDALKLPGRYNETSYRLIQLTTPIAYVVSVEFRDPFLAGENDRGYGDGLMRSHYNYRNHEFWTSSQSANLKLVSWVLNCIGPDEFANQGLMTELWARRLIPATTVTIYDPTNGTTSAGDIMRTGGDTRFGNTGI